MARVSLYEYGEEARQLVQTRAFEAAIDICRHILLRYPKHIRTYQILGEACLEKGELDEAADIFGRLLAHADPENLTSHAGLGVILEERGRIAEAVWHTERAFELASSSEDIRNRLRRLYTKRDGVEPARIKLTQAALARLYARGGQYRQAIEEYRALLGDEPTRLDLKAALADTLWRDGRREEAQELVAEILTTCPTCLRAVLLSGMILMEKGAVQEAQDVLDGARGLDPENRIAHAWYGEHSPLPVELVYVPRMREVSTESVPGQVQEEDRPGSRVAPIVEPGEDQTAGAPEQAAPLAEEPIDVLSVEDALEREQPFEVEASAPLSEAEATVAPSQDDAESRSPVEPELAMDSGEQPMEIGPIAPTTRVEDVEPKPPSVEEATGPELRVESDEVALGTAPDIDRGSGVTVDEAADRAVEMPVKTEALPEQLEEMTPAAPAAEFESEATEEEVDQVIEGGVVPRPGEQDSEAEMSLPSVGAPTEEMLPAGQFEPVYEEPLAAASDLEAGAGDVVSSEQEAVQRPEQEVTVALGVSDGDGAREEVPSVGSEIESLSEIRAAGDGLVEEDETSLSPEAGQGQAEVGSTPADGLMEETQTAVAEDSVPAGAAAAEEGHDVPGTPQMVGEARVVEALASIERYRQHLGRRPKDEKTRLALARAYRDQEQVKLALEQYGQLARGRSKVLPQTVEDMESLVASRPDNLEAHELLADLYVRNGQLQKAVERYRWILQRIEQHPT